MSTNQVAIIRTGCANLASVAGAFARLGLAARVTDCPDEIAAAHAAVLPGVGNFGPALAALRDRGLDGAILHRLNTKQPLLAICLGMQLLCEGSDEARGARGLGIIPGRAVRFPADLRVPHMGWNTLTVDPQTRYLRSADVYFANSYRLVTVPPGYDLALCDYGGPFVAAVERDGLLACQFHPELSGSAGLDLLGRWASASLFREVASC